MWAFPHTTNWQNIFFVAALHVAASCISLENARTTSLAHYQPVLAARVQSPPVKGLKYFFMWLFQWCLPSANAVTSLMMLCLAQWCRFANVSGKHRIIANEMSSIIMRSIISYCRRRCIICVRVQIHTQNYWKHLFHRPLTKSTYRGKCFFLFRHIYGGRRSSLAP